MSFFDDPSFQFRPSVPTFSPCGREKSSIQKESRKGRRRCIGRKRKGTIGGGSKTRKVVVVPKYVASPSPTLRPRTKVPHKYISPDNVVDRSPHL